MIMEALGGDQLWIDRFFAQHCAVFYFWAIIAVFVFSPSLAYVFSELVEVRPWSARLRARVSSLRSWRMLQIMLRVRRCRCRLISGNHRRYAAEHHGAASQQAAAGAGLR